MEINIFPGVHHPFPQLSVMCSNFFNGEEKAPSCFFEQAETEGHLGVDLGLQRVTGWPLCFTMEGGWAFIFQVGVGEEQA